jgi:hypothetical protein
LKADEITLERFLLGKDRFRKNMLLGRFTPCMEGKKSSLRILDFWLSAFFFLSHSFVIL